MAAATLTPLQQGIVTAAGSVFLHGPAGTGKTTIVHERLRSLLADGEPAYAILVLVADLPQRDQIVSFIQQSGPGAYADLKLLYYHQLAREMVQLFWPLVAGNAGFASAYRPPVFIGYDLAQLLMWRLVQPQLDRGAFADLRRRPQQIVSQLLDTLNRAALNQLPLDEATARQMATWASEPAHMRHLQQAETLARDFRRHCLRNNLLDLSLTVETFDRHVLGHAEFSRYFRERFRHVLVDNVEEQTPAGQAFVARMLASTDSALVVYDSGGGYRRFLAADPTGANRLRFKATRVYELGQRFVASPALAQLGDVLSNTIMGRRPPIEAPGDGAATLPVSAVIHTRYRREMVWQVAAQIAAQIATGVAAADIAIVIPYLDGALRYTLVEALKAHQVPINLVRRRASPREEPRVRAWLTWAALAHPSWDVRPTQYDVAEALTLSIAALDPVRAALLAAAVYPLTATRLLPAAELSDYVRARVGDESVAHYEQLRQWLDAHGEKLPLDRFVYDLFNDLLAGPRFQPIPDLEGAGVCNWLVRTLASLVRAAPALGLPTPAAIGRAFLSSVDQGLITSQPPEMGDPPDPDGVLITTIYGYLLRGAPVRHQVWLETASSGWWDIPRQPLSNAFVLAASWQEERPWTVAEEIEIRNEMLSNIVRGLTARCTDGIILATSDLDRRGQRQDSLLWRAFEALLPPAVTQPDAAAAPPDFSGYE